MLILSHLVKQLSNDSFTFQKQIFFIFISKNQELDF